MRSFFILYIVRELCLIDSIFRQVPNVWSIVFTFMVGFDQCCRYKLSSFFSGAVTFIVTYQFIVGVHQF